jgi:hypothetical protein
LVHSAFCSLFKQVINILVDRIFIGEVFGRFGFGHLEVESGQELLAVVDRQAMVFAIFLDDAVKNDLDSVIFGDVLVLFVAAMLAQKGFGVELVFEGLDECGWHLLDQGQEFFSDQFGPVEPEFL